MRCYMSTDYEIAQAEAARVANFKKEIDRRKAVLGEFYGKPPQEICLEDRHCESTAYAVLCWKRARFQVLTAKEVWEIASQTIDQNWDTFNDNLISKHSGLSEPQIGILRKSLKSEEFKEILSSIIKLDALKTDILRMYGDEYFVKNEERHQYKGWHIFRLERTKGKRK